jgi:hypothetical protein
VAGYRQRINPFSFAYLKTIGIPVIDSIRITRYHYAHHLLFRQYLIETVMVNSTLNKPSATTAVILRSAATKNLPFLGKKALSKA